jgi:uncharacterized protein YciI
MPLFAVYATDVANSIEKRALVRPRHVARLEALHAKGQIILAGPCPTDHNTPPTGFTGSILVLDFPDRATLDAWLAEEPYVLEGIYESVVVKPFIQTFIKSTV